MKDLKYLLAYTGPLLVFLGLNWNGWWTWGFTIESFLILPVLELFIKRDTSNVNQEEESSREGMWFFDLLLYSHVPILFLLTFWYLQLITSGTLSTFEMVGLTASQGIFLGGFGINVAHELGHRTRPIERIMAKTLLLPNLYMHFIIEHNLGHHKNVGTDADPASAKKGELVFFFWIRSVVGSYLNAWKLEAKKMKREGKSTFSLSNEMIRFTLFEMAYLAIISWYFGSQGLIFAIIIAAIGFLLLETVNYIEHYGLRRKMLPSGKYERVEIYHSWNSNHEVGRIFLYELTRHADHHYKATRKYQNLRHFDDSPQLPVGYPGAIILALFPPIWFRIMNPRVDFYMKKLSA
ncbi:MAG: alkane 1-monooxygenase [Saprospiraceae bacterium]